MTNIHIKQALIIAAGNGSRLKRSTHDTTPKPLRKLLGMPIIERIILSAKKAGIEAVTVVVGYQADKMAAYFKSRDLGVAVTLVENPDWKKSNGVSALAARTALGNRPFVLLMADHVFDPAALKACIADGVRDGEVKLAVDDRIAEIDDLDDATKVHCNAARGTIEHISKTLPTYTAIDTGMFCCTSALFDVLAGIYATAGDCSLSQGMQILASQGRLSYWAFPKSSYWQDVDTKPAFKIAERKLLHACIKSTDGIISRNFNRRISLFFTRFLVKTGIHANTVTGFTTLVGALSGVTAAHGTYWSFVLGAFLFKMASILDGCDGEMSRLRFSNSKLGQWLDTASDNLTYMMFFIGLMVGVYRQEHSPYFAYWVGMTVFGIGMLLATMFFYLIRYTNSGSLVSLQKDLETRDNLMPKGAARLLAEKCGFMIKRDFFAALFLFFALINEADWILYVTMIGSNVGWMVLFNMRRSIFVASESEVVHDSSY